MRLEDFLRRSISRRTAMKAGTASFLMSQMALFEGLALAPQRVALAANQPSDIQFDIGAFVHPAQTFNDGAGNVVADFGVTFTMLAPARLRRTPTKFDQAVLDEALETIEANFPFTPAGAFVFVLYGLPYFNRLPQALVHATVPRLAFDHTRFVLEESPVFPTDFTGGTGTQNPNIVKDRFNVVVKIEANDVLFEMRSDNLNNLSNILAWLQGSNNLNGNAVASPDFDGLFNFDTPRVNFVQPGMPRKVADNAFANIAQGSLLYEYHGRINPDSPMVMGFMDQQVDSSAPNAATVTFVGDPNNANTQGFSTARAGDYFDNGSIAHLSHDIDDLFQFYALANQDSRRPDGEPFNERVQYMFRSNQTGSGFFGLAAQPNADEFTNGGGPAFVNNVFQGAGAALAAAQDKDGKTSAQTNQDINATFPGTARVGHEEALQRSSRAADGTPLHIRNDGPGFDTLDVPAFQDFPGGTNFAAGTTQFKLHFLAFVPTAEFFRQFRVNGAAQDFQAQFLGGQDDDNGLERFISATRRQNFLIPPRRHRAFPLIELT
jgi:hypothetical protein